MSSAAAITNRKALAAALSAISSGIIALYVVQPIDMLIARIVNRNQGFMEVAQGIYDQGLLRTYASTSSGIAKEIVGSGGFWFAYEKLKAAYRAKMMTENIPIAHNLVIGQ